MDTKELTSELHQDDAVETSGCNSEKRNTSPQYRKTPVPRRKLISVSNREELQPYMRKTHDVYNEDNYEWRPSSSTSLAKLDNAHKNDDLAIDGHNVASGRLSLAMNVLTLKHLDNLDKKNVLSLNRHSKWQFMPSL